MPKQLVDPTREQALKILRKTETALSFPKLLMTSQEESATARRARALVYQLVMGTLRYRATLDWALDRKSSAPVTELSSWIRNILRMGLYQILFLDRIPKSAAVDESVKLAKKYGHAGTAGLVNAVLRNSHREELLQAIEDMPEDNPADLAVKYSHPQWMVETLLADWGMEQTIRILKNNNVIPPVTGRVNTILTERERLLAELQEQGVHVSALPLAVEAVEFAGDGSPQNSAAYEKGLFYLQDVSSMLAAHCIDAQPGQRVLDACAGPGGKATHMAALMRNEGEIYALDAHAHRVALIEENARRLGARIIQARRQDATEDLTAAYGGVDRALTDVPCSGLGVIRRRIDLKWRLRPQQVDELARLQSAILERAAECVRPGGLLVYCTCTITRKENAGLVKQFLQRHTLFRVAPVAPAVPEKYVDDEGFAQILPGDDNMDGFFIARLKRL
jgi:16S rRNA (cytosine967-C5)-methyltransferase